MSRVGIVDWDAHHGNGTQAAFFDDPDVLTISLHQADCFPPESGVDEVDEGGSRTSTSRCRRARAPAPLRPPSTASSCRRSIAHRPELVLVACGFDSSAWDPHARLMLHSAAYRELTRALLGVADRHASGRLVVIHEGGYAPGYTPFCGLAVLEELSGFSTGVEDPFLPIFTGYGYQELQPHQDAVIAAAASLR